MALAFIGSLNIQPAKAAFSYIYIRANGDVDPPSAPISNSANTIYTLTDNIVNYSIVIQRDNIKLDGAGHTLQGPRVGYFKGLDLTGRKNVTVQNIEIKAFYIGVNIEFKASNNTISGSTITKNALIGIYLNQSTSNNISGNTITDNNAGISLSGASNDNTIKENTFINNGLVVLDSYENKVLDNTVNGKWLAYLEDSSGFGVLNAGQVILLNCSNIRIENLDVSNATIGVTLLETNDCYVGNNTMANNAYGIYIYKSSKNRVLENTITNSLYGGIYLGFSSNNNITRNNVANTLFDGVLLEAGSDHNRLAGNTVANSLQYGISLLGSSNNLIYHNNFVDNAQQAYIIPSGYANSWDNGLPSGGNYWSDYSGTDTDGDGLGETEIHIADDNVDHHPLMGLFSAFNAGTWNDITYYVDIISKSTINNFNFNASSRTLSFDLQGGVGTPGFCRITIPTGLMWCDSPAEWAVTVGGFLTDRTVTSSSGYTYMYFTYTHSTKTVHITSTHAVQEFPMLILLLLISTAALFASVFARKCRKNSG
ncbi:MAG: NosD domain-containing protein [Candidatus Bathyarchaeia archaeon]